MNNNSSNDAAPENQSGIKRSSRRIASAVLAAIALAFVVVKHTPREPERFGLSLTQCLNLLLVDDGLGPTTAVLNTDAKRSLRAMGDDAISHLLRILTPDSRLKQQADQLMKANPLKSHSPARHRSPATWEIEAARWTAGIAFHYLGNDASRPLDDLATLLENHQGTTSWENLSSIHGAAIAMAAIEPEGVDILIAHATGTDPILRNAAIEGLGYAHSPDSRHIILLLNHALDKNVQTRTLAIEALGRARKEPNQTVPLLIAGLKDPAIVAQILAARSLGWFGSDASSALPALRQSSKSTNFLLAAESQTAINTIESAVAVAK